jgi:cytochrome c
MKTRSALILLGLATTGLQPFAAQIDWSKLPPTSDKQGVTYAKDIRPLLEASCFRCHGEKRPHGDLRLDSLEALRKGGEDGEVIIPGKSRESPLLIAVAQLDDETAMPPKRRQGSRGPGGPPEGQFRGPGGPARPDGPDRAGDSGPPPTPLTAEQVGLVRAWIDQGAK